MNRDSAAITGGALTGMGIFANRVDAATSPISRMSAAPSGISTRDEFLSAFMPNLFELWRNGVKFEGHSTSGTACSPGRAAFVSGLYPHQNWTLQARKGQGGLGPNARAMRREFPTYGTILRDAGYDTPYAGKWHLSNAPSSPSARGAPRYLQEYGFQGLTMPDVVGETATASSSTRPSPRLRLTGSNVDAQPTDRSA